MTEQVANPTGEQVDADWLGILAGAEQAADAARERLNFGKLTITPRYLRWIDRKPTEISATDYAGLPDSDRSLELVFAVDIQEFSPDLEWSYERRVGVGSLDWKQILKPSIESIYGDGTMLAELMAATLGKMRGHYVKVADVLQTPTKKDPNPEYRTIKFATVFESRGPCFAEWEQRYGQTDDAGSDDESLAAPTGWAAEWDGFNFQEDVVPEIAGQVESFGGLDGVASDYYGVETESLVRALNAGGMSNKAISDLDDGLTPGAVAKLVK